MKNYIRLLLVIFGLFISMTGWAVDQFVMEFSGVPEGKVHKNVKSALQNLQTEMTKPVRARVVRVLYKKGADKIRAAMEPYGYFRLKIRSKLAYQHHIWTASFFITPGAPIRVTQLDLDIVGVGAQDRTFKRLRQHFPVKVGETLHTETYEEARQLLHDLASKRGFFDAKMIENKIYINLKTYQARVVFKFKPGHRYFFGHTIFSKTPFSPRFLRRFLSYKTGQYYNYRRVQRTQNKLINSDYFAQVIVDPAHKEAVNYDVPIKIKLIPRERIQYTFGLGFGTDTGPRGTAGFILNRVNASGHRFNTLLQAAQNYSSLTAHYIIPGADPVNDLFTFSAGYADFDQVTGKGNSRKLSADYTTAIGNWQQTIALTYLNERYNIVTFPFTKTQVTYPSINWQYVSTKNILRSRNGFNFSGLIAGTVKSALSKTTFSQIRLNAKLITTVFSHTRILLRASIARTNIKNLENLPFSLQLFAGGARSIRGYRYNALGPGRNLFIGSLEIQQRITGDWYIAAFYDVGSVSDDNPFIPRDLFQGVGPGIVWLSPIGALEITIANAINEPNHPWLIQFTMGPEL